MSAWKLQDAKARFSELLDTVLKKGPQTVTRRGVETAVIVPMADWKRIQQASRPTLKDLLLADGPRFTLPPANRRARKRRAPAELS